MLSSIPDRELIARLEALRRDERDASLDLLQHLNEVERRDLFLRLGYSSLFAYCTGHLGYAEYDAARRVQAARCLQRFPRVAALLQNGEINLTTLGMIANLVTTSTVDEWLERIRHKTQREVEALVAAVRAPVTLRDRARVVHVAVPDKAPLPLAPVKHPDIASPDSSLFTTPPGTPDEPESEVRSAPLNTVPIQTEAKVYIQFLVDQSFMVRYRIAIAVLSNRLPRLTFEAVFTALLDDFIRRHEPVTRHQRRQKALSANESRQPRRDALPVTTRDAVFARDLGRCTFVGSDGKRCNETLHLHIDHIKPVVRGGTNDIGNLRLLCARHNQLQAEKLLGRKAMEGFRKSS